MMSNSRDCDIDARRRLSPRQPLTEKLEPRQLLTGVSAITYPAFPVKLDGFFGRGEILRDLRPAGVLSSTGLKHLAHLVPDSTGTITPPSDGGGTTGTPGNFRIVLKEGPNLKKNPAAAAAFRAAADYVQTLFTDPITVVVDAEIQSLGSGVIGQTDSSEFHFTKSDYDGVRKMLVKDASAKEPIVAKLPTMSELQVELPTVAEGTDPFTFGGLTATRAQLLALGMKPADLTAAPNSEYDSTVKRDMSMTFSSDFAFDYNRADGIASGKMDFTGVVEHELAHGMGFLSDVDTADYLKDLPGFDRTLYPTLLDLFRLKPGDGKKDFTHAVRVLATGDLEPNQVVYDGGVFDPAGFKMPGLTKGDIPMSTGNGYGDGQQASHWKDDDDTNITIGILDPTAKAGRQLAYSETDIRVLGLIGWDVAGPGSVAGTVFTDNNANGTRDGTETVLGGITVFLDANKNGRFDTNETSVTTTTDGTYLFPEVAAGSYRVSYNTPDNTIPVTPDTGSTDVTVGANQAVTGINFGVSAPIVVLPPGSSGWASNDIGVVGSAGDTIVTSDGAISMIGSGAGVGGTVDAFQYTYQSLPGNGEIVARVKRIGAGNNQSAAGLMIRQDLGGRSRNVFIGLTRGDGLQFSSRSRPGGITATSSASGQYPIYLRLVRNGTTFTAFSSANGTAWTRIGSRTIAGMTGSLIVGLAVSSHNDASVLSAAYEKVEVTRTGIQLRPDGTPIVGDPPLPTDVPPNPNTPATAEEKRNADAGLRSDGAVPWL